MNTICIVFQFKSACVVRVPVEIIKQRQQTSKRLAKNIIVEIAKTEGVQVYFYSTMNFNEIFRSHEAKESIKK